jgi:hypothetical protein
MGFFRIPDPKPIILIAKTNCWVKNTINVIVLAKKNFFYLSCSKQDYLQFYDICGYKKCLDKKSFPSPLLVLLLDPGWIKIRG